MNYDKIVAGLRALQSSDFDYNNVDARGWERLSELTAALGTTLYTPEEAASELFDVMERMPTADLGSPGPLVHTLEAIKRYEKELVPSVRRCPSLLSVWMINRILNTDLSKTARESYLAVLMEATSHPNASETVREDARRFIEFQMRKDSPPV